MCMVGSFQHNEETSRTGPRTSDLQLPVDVEGQMRTSEKYHLPLSTGLPFTPGQGIDMN